MYLVGHISYIVYDGIIVKNFKLKHFHNLVSFLFIIRLT